MTHDVVTGYQVIGEMETAGGRGVVTLGYCTDQAVAGALASGRGYQGEPARIDEVPAIVVEGKCYVLRDEAPVDLHETYTAALRAVALSKLTVEEREALGVP